MQDASSAMPRSRPITDDELDVITSMGPHRSKSLLKGVELRGDRPREKAKLIRVQAEKERLEEQLAAAAEQDLTCCSSCCPMRPAPGWPNLPATFAMVRRISGRRICRRRALRGALRSSTPRPGWLRGMRVHLARSTLRG